MSNAIITIRSKLVWFFEREEAIRKELGLLKLCRRTISYVLTPIFWRRTFIIHSRQIEDHTELNENDFKPDIENWSFKNVSSHEEAEKLEAQGFMFRYWPTFDNKKLKYYSKLLDEGCTALCGFAGKDLAFIVWAIPSEKAIHRVKYYRHKIDFSRGERYLQGPWVNPKYQGMGLLKYSHYFNSDPFLRNNGGKVLIGVLWDEREALIKVMNATRYKPYAKAKVTRFLWWKYWEGETPLDSTDHDG
ncbi:MAG: hypothetical protein HQ553_12470 [Chloroflexi bacterium]|nr:hypothetical protein [Chloroflexota bacterium]